MRANSSSMQQTLSSSKKVRTTRRRAPTPKLQSGVASNQARTLRQSTEYSPANRSRLDNNKDCEGLDTEDHEYHSAGGDKSLVQASVVTKRSTANVEVPDLVKKGNYVLMRVGIPRDMRYAIVTQSQYTASMEEERSFWSTAAANASPAYSEREIIVHVASVLNQLVFKVSVDYVKEQNQELLEELEYLQQECWENDKRNQNKKLVESLKKQVALKRKKLGKSKGKKSQKATQERNMPDVKRKHRDAVEVEQKFQDHQTTTPYYWDHVTSSSKTPVAFSYTIPVGFYDGNSSDPLVSRMAELVILQNDSIRREKKEEIKKKKKPEMTGLDKRFLQFLDSRI